MNIQRCVNGHYYDAERYADGCPYCKTQNPVTGARDFTGDGKNADITDSKNIESEKTLPMFSDSGQSDSPDPNVTMPLEPPVSVEQKVKSDEGVTMPLTSQLPFSDKTKSDEGVTMPLPTEISVEEKPIIEENVDLPVCEDAPMKDVRLPEPEVEREYDGQTEEKELGTVVERTNPVPSESENEGVTMPVPEQTLAEQDTVAEDYDSIQSGNSADDTLPISETTLRSIKKCKNNHLYNGDRFSECPYCKNNVVITEISNSDEHERVNELVAPTVETKNTDATMPLTPPDEQKAKIDEGVTMPLTSQSPFTGKTKADEGATMPLTSQPPITGGTEANVGVTMPLTPPSAYANNSVIDDGRTMPLDYGATPNDSYIQQNDTAVKMSYKEFLKAYVPKKKRRLLHIPGIWAVIYAVITLGYGAADSYHMLGYVIIAVAFVVPAVLIILKKKIIFPILLLVIEAILLIMTIVMGEFNLGWIDIVTIATAVEAIIFGSQMQKSYKEYILNGTIPQKMDDKT